jgi:hypothetical protein
VPSGRRLAIPGKLQANPALVFTWNCDVLGWPGSPLEGWISTVTCIWSGNRSLASGKRQHGLKRRAFDVPAMYLVGLCPGDHPAATAEPALPAHPAAEMTGMRALRRDRFGGLIREYAQAVR